jgi:uncharacterized protein YbjT (DUF2867 family)
MGGEGARAFVAGATGLTGRSVVERLRARGVETVAHVRPDSSKLAEWRERFGALGAAVDTTPWDEASMTEALRARAPTHVFALLGTTRARARRAAKAGRDPAAESYEAVDYGLTALLRRAAEASGHGPRFVYLSAMGVSPSTRNPYLAARARLEAELREGALPYTVVRPSFILGERDAPRRGEALGAALIDGSLGLLGALGARRLRDRYRSIGGEQLATALVRLAFDPAAENRVVEADELR